MRHEKRPKTPGKAAPTRRAAHTIRLPGFLIDDAVGLGDVITRTASYIGLRPCGGCERRAQALNRWVAFSGPKAS